MLVMAVSGRKQGEDVRVRTKLLTTEEYGSVLYFHSVFMWLPTSYGKSLIEGGYLWIGHNVPQLIANGCAAFKSLIKMFRDKGLIPTFLTKYVDKHITSSQLLKLLTLFEEGIQHVGREQWPISDDDITHMLLLKDYVMFWGTPYGQQVLGTSSTLLKQGRCDNKPCTEVPWLQPFNVLELFSALPVHTFCEKVRLQFGKLLYTHHIEWVKSDQHRLELWSNGVTLPKNLKMATTLGRYFLSAVRPFSTCETSQYLWRMCDALLAGDANTRPKVEKKFMQVVRLVKPPPSKALDKLKQFKLPKAKDKNLQRKVQMVAQPVVDKIVTQVIELKKECITRRNTYKQIHEAMDRVKMEHNTRWEVLDVAVTAWSQIQNTGVKVMDVNQLTATINMLVKTRKPRLQSKKKLSKDIHTLQQSLRKMVKSRKSLLESKRDVKKSSEERQPIGEKIQQLTTEIQQLTTKINKQLTKEEDMVKELSTNEKQLEVENKKIREHEIQRAIALYRKDPPDENAMKVATSVHRRIKNLSPYWLVGGAMREALMPKARTVTEVKQKKSLAMTVQTEQLPKKRETMSNMDE